MHRRKHAMLPTTLHIKKLIPNLITIASMFIGLTQIKFAFAEKWNLVVTFTLLSAILDASDGLVARKLGTSSRFGAELDSIADFAAFGIGPAISLYLYSLFYINRIGWVAAIFFAMCMGLRLARFNTLDIENKMGDKRFFIGVPAPAGAILAEFPIILYNAFKLEIFQNPYLCFITSIITGVLCISTIRTLSIKKRKIKKEHYKLFFFTVMFIPLLIFTFTWKFLVCLVILYIISIFSCHFHNEKRSGSQINLLK